MKKKSTAEENGKDLTGNMLGVVLAYPIPLGGVLGLILLALRERYCLKERETLLARSHVEHRNSGHTFSIGPPQHQTSRKRQPDGERCRDHTILRK